MSIRANSLEFSPVLANLKNKHPNSEVIFKLCSRIRTLGISRRSPNHSSPSSGYPIYATHRGLFKLTKQESLFKEVFDDIIQWIANKQVVTKVEILTKAHNSVRLAPLLLEMQQYCPSCNLDVRIFNKVRSLGQAIRVSQFNL